jgi:hypothetical protein
VKNRYSAEEKAAYAEEMRQRDREAEEAEIEKWEIDIDNIVPPLEGTEKQIAWARKIRYDVLSPAIGPAGLRAVCYSPSWAEDAVEMGVPKETIEQQRDAILYIRFQVLPLLGETSAKWWIDHREMPPFRAKHILRNWDAFKEYRRKAASHKAARPRRPARLVEIYAAAPEGSTWNMTVYGSERSGYEIYVANTEYKLTAGEAEEIKRYAEALNAWEAAGSALEKDAP